MTWKNTVLPSAGPRQVYFVALCLWDVLSSSKHLRLSNGSGLGWSLRGLSRIFLSHRTTDGTLSPRANVSLTKYLLIDMGIARMCVIT
mmetsp:Transcript_27437/g.83468  ORF Transcript_27437/g.83468 Transcript_27437/m.83468 type:complete len:88 (+) Transcript_27437:3214-3477(+)|eukprot:scaffold211780_cov43-Tisochrysis_lutea.AAC.1